MGPIDPSLIPQTAYEKLYQTWNPAEYELVSQFFGVSIVAAANATGQNGQIQVPEPMYVFALLSCAFLTVGGTVPTVNYRIGFRTSRGEDWTNGTQSAAIVTGDALGRGWRPMVWQSPRYMAQNEILIAAVDNNINGAASITVDASVWGLTVRQRRADAKPQ